MPQGRPPKDQTRLQSYIPTALFEQMFLLHPELFQSKLPPKFRHGALGLYLTSLIQQDLRRRSGVGSSGLPGTSQHDFL